MGRELCTVFAVFAQAFEEACECLDSHMEQPLRKVLFAAEASADAELLERTGFAQAGLFALEVALFRLLESWGVRPMFLLGHSIGELAAAHVAGVFSLEDACRLVAARGSLMGALPAGGAMVSLQASEREVLATLVGLEGRVALAAVNGPASVVLSGEEQAVLDLAATWRARGRKTKQLQVSHAFHSPLMDAMLEEFAEVAAGLSFAAPQIPIVSNVTGGTVAADELCSSGYWLRHVRQTVRFMDGVRWLAGQRVRSFLELGPDGVLSAMTRDCLAGAEDDAAVVAVPALRAERPEARALLSAVGEVWAHGADVAWGQVFAGSGAKRVALPTYAFQGRRYWLQAQATDVGDAASMGQAAASHPLLGAAVALAEDGGWLFTGRISLATHPWLADHAVMGVVLLPGTAFVELALHAGGELGCERLGELTLEAPLVLPKRGAVQIQVSLGPLEVAPNGAPNGPLDASRAGGRPLAIYSRPEPAVDGGVSDEEAQWTRHASGVLLAGRGRRGGSPAWMRGRWPSPAGRGRQRVRRRWRSTICMTIWPGWARLRLDVSGPARRLAARRAGVRGGRPARGSGGRGETIRRTPRVAGRGVTRDRGASSGRRSGRDGRRSPPGAPPVLLERRQAVRHRRPLSASLPLARRPRRRWRPRRSLAGGGR